MDKKVCTLLLLKKDNQVLLAMKKRGFGVNRWNGVGGKVNPDETIEQALVRECREEIGVIPMKYEKVGESIFHEFHAGKPAEMEVHIYLCDEWEGEPSESEEMRPKWFAIEDIPYTDMWPDDEYWLPQILTGSKIIAEFNLDEEDKIFAHNVQVVESIA